jgi:hypothetical protein
MVLFFVFTVIPVYHLRLQLQAPFRGAQVNEQQKNWNKAMSALRQGIF